MFETRQEIRKAAVEREVRKRVKKGLEEAVREALEDKLRQISKRAETLNIPPEDIKKLLEVKS